jgi:SAM-dependent methyltransferase
MDTMDNKNEDTTRDHFRQCADFLTKFVGLWSQEVLNNYPTSFDAYPQDWLSELSSLSSEEQWLLECRKLPNHSLTKQLIKPLEQIESVPHWPLDNKEITYPTWAFQKVSAKKQHEITSLTKLVSQISGQESPKRILDIGGGAGHLARILSYYHGHDVTSLDQSSEFQDLGRKRLVKYPIPDHAGQVTFLPHQFGQKDDTKHFNNIDLSIGLHTCGPLALDHLKQAITLKNHQLINIGCCYHKLDKSDVPDVMVSKLASDYRLRLSKHALTLATRGRTEISPAQFELKKRVKYYRAALHLYLYYEHGLTDFITMGSSLPATYRQDFANYAIANIKNTRELTINPSQKELNDFYKRPQIQETLNKIFYANLIRWQFSRVIEKTILLDRVLWLREHGLNARLYQIFDALISPRNMMIVIS